VTVETKYEPISPAEALRTPESVMEPDPRNAYFGFYPPSLEIRHADIAALTLNITMPEEVAIQFETARNLYLYAWYVYRFHMVAAKLCRAGSKRTFVSTDADHCGREEIEAA
jgi:hypothetical protein